VACVLGQQYFATRPAWNWRNSMALWNLGLSVFSTIGFVRTLPQLAHNLFNYSLTENLCFDPESHFGSGATGFWVQMFCLSKIPYVSILYIVALRCCCSVTLCYWDCYCYCLKCLVYDSLFLTLGNHYYHYSELLDTFFIVIHKKPLIFLHWYHHVSVLLYCWHAYVTKAPGGLFFVTMNFGVHAIMYFYYFLMAVKLKPKWFNSIYITVCQISQMVVGVTVTVLGFVLAPSYEKACALKPENNAAALIMYGSYLLLFVQFFMGRYQVRGSKKVTKSQKKKD
jgi:elongation of very long chain fatty acids protein 6